MAVAAPLSAEDIASLEAAGLGHIGAKVRALLDRQAHDRHEIEWRDAKIEKLTFEMAQLRRVKFGKKSEQLDAEQKVDEANETADSNSKTIPVLVDGQCAAQPRK